MRSYWMSLTLVAVLLLGYTAIVLNSHASTSSPKIEAPHASAETQPREPAAQTTTTESKSAVD